MISKKNMKDNYPGPILALVQELVFLTLKIFEQKGFSRMLGHRRLMLNHKPITTKRSDKSFSLKAF